MFSDMLAMSASGGGKKLQSFATMTYNGSYNFTAFDGDKTPPVSSMSIVASDTSSGTFTCDIGSFRKLSGAYHSFNITFDVDCNIYGSSGSSTRTPPTGITDEGTYWHAPAGTYSASNFYDWVDGSRSLYFLPS